MGKKNKRSTADKVRRDKKSTEKKINPFEVRINRQKHVILGRKSKHDKGFPGISRSKANNKRKETLLKEYLNRKKSNLFVDKRLGENDPNMSVEEKMMQRFAFEKQKSHEKSAAYNLNEEEDLTHYGQSIADIEQFEDQEESDHDEDGKLNADYVEQEHFGGLLTRKKPESQESKPKSREEIFDEIIAKSKREKYDRKQEKEEVTDMREKLDDEWKAVSQLLSKAKRKQEDTEVTKSDDYDIAVRSLLYDMKAKATDRLKTPEEIAKLEKLRLEKLEEDRQRRMKGILEEDVQRKQATHLSADSLCDGYDLSSNKKSAKMLSYHDGKLVDPSLLGQGEKESESEDEEDNINEEENEDKSENEGEGESDASDDEEDDMEDLEDEDDESEEEEIAKEQMEEIIQKRKETVKKRKEVMEKAKKELPFTFTAPETYEEFAHIIDGHTTQDVRTIIERIRATNHPSLAEGNKQKLEEFFGHLLVHFCEVASDEQLNIPLLDILTKHLYELAQMSPGNAGRCVHDLIKDRYEDFKGTTEGKGRIPYPQPDVLLCFKLISVIFPTSDFRHPVVTPTLLFMGNILSRCSVHDCHDVAIGLFMCNLFLQYVSLCKRFVPEVINYLHGILFLAKEKNPNRISHHVIPPFKPVGKFTDILQLKENAGQIKALEPFRLSTALCRESSEKLETDQFRVNAIALCLELVQSFAILYEDLPSYREIFLTIKESCCSQDIPWDVYPVEVKELRDQVVSRLSKQDGQLRRPLTSAEKTVPMLKMFEPKIDERLVNLYPLIHLMLFSYISIIDLSNLSIKPDILTNQKVLFIRHVQE
ncbi:nucleolar protein 14-like [Anneissia japonica]|uniref:nucleolar protein 14-like n=1 Tax=Anneissia japonica TaxID=1529436 RepID=UPI001425B314|nr:nucleolar protein 14-like [Anneissia japonica]